MTLPDINFSIKELEQSLFYMVLNTITGILIAFLTFEGEYFSGRYVEKIFETIGILKMNWMLGHQILFLHIIQLVFIVTFILEIKYIVVKYTQSWKL